MNRPSLLQESVLTSLPREALDSLEIAYLIPFGAFLATAWVGFTLAELGIDNPIVVLALGMTAAFTSLLATQKRHWKAVAPAAVLGLAIPLAIGSALFFPPDEWILGAADPGVYVSTGAIIAKQGRIVFQSPTLARLTPSLRQALVAVPVIPGPPSRLPGFYLSFLKFRGVVPVGLIVSDNQIVPHAFHLYPSVLAFGYALGGIRTELLVTPFLALAGLASFYLLSRRLFGAPVGVIAVTLLAIDPAEVWFARFPAAEVLVQFLVLGGLFALVAFLDSPSPWLGVIAGAALGEASQTKIETVLIPFLVAAFLIYQIVTGRGNRCWWWFGAVYVILLAQATLHALIISGMYTVTTFSIGNTWRLIEAASGSLLLAFFALGVVVRSSPWRKAVARWLSAPLLQWCARIGLPVLICLAGIYAYFIRPLASAGLTSGPNPDPGQIAALNNLQSFVRLGWYVGPVGLFLGTLGWMLLTHEKLDRRTALPYLLVLADAVIFLGDTRANPVHYWSARRWVPLVIPGMCLGAAYALIRFVPRARGQWPRALLPAACGLALTLELFGGLRPLLGYVEYRGAIDQFAAFASEFPPNAVLLFSNGESGRRYTTPLEFLDDRTTFVIPDDPAVDAAAKEATGTWLAQGRPVYWIELANGRGPSQIGLAGTVVGHQHIALVEKLAVSDRPPGADGLFQQDLAIWKVEVGR